MIMEQSYEELTDLVQNIIEDYGVTTKEAFDIALKIQANELSAINNKSLVGAIIDLDQTIARAFVVNDTSPSAFELLASSIDRIANIQEINN